MTHIIAPADVGNHGASPDAEGLKDAGKRGTKAERSEVYANKITCSLGGVTADGAGPYPVDLRRYARARNAARQS